MKDIDKILTDIENRFLKKLRKLDKLGQVDKIKLYAELDFFTELQNEGLSKFAGDVYNEYAQKIKALAKYKTEGIAAIAYEDLELIAQLDEAQILRSGQLYADSLKSRLMKGLVSGDSIEQMLADVNIPGFKENWRITAINQSITEFEQTAMAKVFEDAPEQRFVLSGPVDEFTRDACRGVMTMQPAEGWTKAEIDGGAASALAGVDYNWTFRGGFNCRHIWEVAE